MPDTEMRPWRMALAKLWAPVPWMLEATIILQAVLHEYVEAGVIAGLLVFNADLGFFRSALIEGGPGTQGGTRTGYSCRAEIAACAHGFGENVCRGAGAARRSHGGRHRNWSKHEVWPYC